MSILSHPHTYDDLIHTRETTDDRLELIEGELVVTPSPTPLHQLVVHRLAVMLDRVIVEPHLGLVLEAPLDAYLDERNILQPDLVVLLHDRKDLFGSAKLEGAPNLAIEVISPSTGRRDRGIKRDLYARNGVPGYWVVDAETKTVTVFSDPEEGRYRSETVSSDTAVSATIPNVTADLAALFAPAFGA
jgi:Uma2 family endonuclease